MSKDHGDSLVAAAGIAQDSLVAASGIAQDSLVAASCIAQEVAGDVRIRSYNFKAQEVAVYEHWEMSPDPLEARSQASDLVCNIRRKGVKGLLAMYDFEDKL